MSTVYDSLMQGLTEALNYAQGKETGAVVHQIAAPTVDVTATQASIGLSQHAVAPSIGVTKGAQR